MKLRQLDLIGNTPLVHLSHYSTDDVQIYAKLEMYNPGGSVKDRLGKYLIEQALNRGDLLEGVTVVEATAGNTGIGLLMAAIPYHIDCVIFAPEGFAEEKMATMRALGATIYRTPREEGMVGARQQAQAYAQTHHAFYTNQFETIDNPKAYQHTLASEILTDLPDIDCFVAGAGSGGTFSGVAERFVSQGIRCVVVEPRGSILSGNEKGRHDTEGIGVETWPTFLKREWIDAVEVVSDAKAFQHVKDLARYEGLLVGSSSGAALEGALQTAKRLEKGKIVVVFPDGSDRYLSKNIFTYGGMQDE
ncbi:PLP-dependent cysteine synthase family protein [Staphylococcus chromogenes]|uniref:PLP-dependent cysteine synthase family protein n=1 Tax=Staphylococcus chromogenes TaxID=46126 RepID=UPI000D03A62A|nr:cysteine synthase family protein [Staphylococcus chromogenes]PTG21630.1 cysteine synthase family protein [Staphylococcus chromogenes]PTG95570.1 cysteine synthase family protein [Staphylococcus chromogenes]